MSEVDEIVAKGPIATPNQSIEPINKVVSVLFTYKRPAMYKDVAIATNLHRVTVSQALSASRDMGLTTSGGKKGLYVLTKSGQEYARLLTAGKENKAKPYLGELLQSQPAYKEIVMFLNAIRGEARDPLDLVIDIERKLSKTWSQSARTRYRENLVSILVYAGLVQKKGNRIFSLLGEETPSEEVTPEIATPTHEDYELLQTNDFRFEIRKDADALTFAKSQFLAWIEYLQEKMNREKESES